MKTIKVYERECLDVDQPPENMIKYIAWLTDKLDQIPDEFRKNAEVEMVSNDMYGLEYVISYTRPETREELAEAIREVQRRDSEIERKERAELERLNKKYHAAILMGKSVKEILEEEKG